MAAAALVGALALPAGAEEPDIPYFTEVTGSAVAVSGTYTPVVGPLHRRLVRRHHLVRPRLAAPTGSGPRAPGCESGQFTKDVLDPQVNGEYSAIVGNFSGDSLDDIFWWSGHGKDYLWTNNGSGAFTSRPAQHGGGRLGADRDHRLAER